MNIANMVNTSPKTIILPLVMMKCALDILPRQVYV